MFLKYAFLKNTQTAKKRTHGDYIVIGGLQRHKPEERCIYVECCVPGINNTYNTLTHTYKNRAHLNHTQTTERSAADYSNTQTRLLAC